MCSSGCEGGLGARWWLSGPLAVGAPAPLGRGRGALLGQLASLIRSLNRALTCNARPSQTSRDGWAPGARMADGEPVAEMRKASQHNNAVLPLHKGGTHASRWQCHGPRHEQVNKTWNAAEAMVVARALGWHAHAGQRS